MTRRLAALLAVLAALLGTALLFAGPAEAHATVASSDPRDGTRLQAAPKTVSITFDESVGLGKIGYLHVTDGSGKRVDAGAATHPNGDGSIVRDTLKPGLGDGSYTASFRVVSADSHPVAGTIRFVVGDGALVRGSVAASGGNELTETVFDALRWVSFAGFALLGGVWVVLTIWPEGRDDRRARRVIWAGWGAMVFGAVAELLMQGPYAAGFGPTRLFDGTLLDATLHSDYGQLHSLRLVLLGLLAIVFARSLQAGARPARWEAVVGVAGIGLAWSFSGTGHAGTTAPSLLSVPVDMLHLLSMAAWVGGLTILVTAVLPRREPAELRAVTPVVSTVSFTSVVVLAASGTYSAWRGIGTKDAIFTTTYGLLVLAKVVLFVGLLALGNLSRLAVRRRFTRPQLAYAMTDTVVEETEDETEIEDLAAERLRRSVFVEMLVAFTVLILSAVLVAEPRGKESLAAQYREPVAASASLGSGRTVTVTSDPGTHGTVDLSVDVTAGPKPTAITANATQVARKIGPIPVKLTRAGELTFDGSADLPVAGRWQISLVITTSEFDATTTDVTIDLH